MNLKGLAAATIAAGALSLAAAPRLPEGWAVNASRDAARACGAQVGGLGFGPARLVLRCTQAGGGSFALTQAIAAAPYRGRRLQLTARIRTQALNGRAGLSIQAETADRRVLALDDMRLAPIAGTTDWTDARVLLDVDAAAESITLGVVIDGGPGIAWVEALKFDIADPDDPGVAIIVRPSAPELPVRPRNLELRQ